MNWSDQFSYPAGEFSRWDSTCQRSMFPPYADYGRTPGASILSLEFSTPADVQALAGAFDPLTSIDWGTKLATTTVDVYFAPAGSYIDGVTDFGKAQGFTTFEKQQILSAYNQFAKYTNLTFRETTSQNGAEFRVGTFDLDAYDLVAFGVPPGRPYSGFIGIDPDYLKWLDADSGNPLLSRGGIMYAIMLEEGGHALGLAHPHDEGGTSTILPGVTAPVGSYGVGDLDQGVFTIMGYNDGWPAGPYGDAYYDGTHILVNDFGYEATPMALDVAVLQAKYGANLNWANGDNVYRLPTNNGLGTFFECIWDTGGKDTVRYDGKADAIVDLRPASLAAEVGGGGYVSYAAGVRGGYTIAAGTRIENAVGDAGNDVLTGNDARNSILGRAGADIVFGGRGGDSIHGGDGSDRLNGNAGNDHVSGGEGRDWIAGSGGNDILEGQAGNDSLVGGGGDDTLLAGWGDDILRGDSGDDVIDGGPGTDRVVFAGTIDTSVRLGTNAVQATGHGSDRILRVENVTSAGGNDLLAGNGAANVLKAGTGEDSLFGGRGDDTVVGNGGDDVLRGDAGDDVIDGGAGQDRFVFRVGFGNDRIVGFADNVDSIRLDDAIWGGGLTAAELVSSYGSVVHGSSVLDFGGGNSITVLGFSNLAALVDDLVIT